MSIPMKGLAFIYTVEDKSDLFLLPTGGDLGSGATLKSCGAICRMPLAL